MSYSFLYYVNRSIHHFYYMSAKNTYPKSNHEERLDIAKLSNILQNKLPVYFRYIKIMKHTHRKKC